MATLNMMKKLSIATAGAAFIALGIGGAAQAASFSFSYTLDSGSILSGILEGDVQADGDAVLVSSITSSSFDGVASPDLPLVQSVLQLYSGAPATATVSFSGLLMDIIATTDASITDGFLFESSGALFGVPVYNSGFSYGSAFELYNPQRWQLSAQSVPEPTSTFGLLGLGAIGAGSMLKRKQQKKVTVKA